TRAWVNSDPVLLERILSNLVSNAIRYTQHGGVVVGARRRENRIALEGGGSGGGIGPSERERIFEEVYQVGNPERHSSKGTGLGLSITRRLANLLGHGLQVDSRPGLGSRFSVELPRATAESPSMPAPHAFVPGEPAPLLAGAQVAVID